jgi:serine/threonine-protein kinase
MSDESGPPDGDTKTDVHLPERRALADDSESEATHARGRSDTVLDDTLAAMTPHGDDAALLAELTEDLAQLDFEHRYARVGMVGEGGMGEVGLYEDQQIGREVAVKTLHESHRKDRGTRARFLREARVQAQLEHPSIVPVYDMGVDDDGHEYFTMKRVRGHSLEEILDDQRDGDEEAKRTYTKRRLLTAFGNVCLAVDFAHRRGVLHRDLKPANIMLGDFGEVYVLDWGLARVSEIDGRTGEMPQLMSTTTPKTALGAILGTPGYMAPEQMRGQHSSLGPTADVYSLGVILFEICTREDFHPRSSIEDIYRSTLNGIEARPSVRMPHLRVPIELEEIIVRAVAQDPKARFPSARALYDALERYLDGERDDERRLALSREHAARARELGTRTESSLDDRRVAMRELGRSLALDPENHAARDVLMSILKSPPKALPPEVVSSLGAAEETRRRRSALTSIFGYLSLLFYLPLMAWLGIRHGGSLVPLFLFALLAAGAAAYVWRVRTSSAAVLSVMALSTVALASSATLFGPLLVTPMLIATNTTAFALLLEGRHRLISMVTGIGVLLAVMALGLSGALPGGYAFDDGAMHVLPGAVHFPEAPTIVFLAIVSIATIVTPSILAGQIRDTLGDLERQLYLYGWHLSELVPGGPRDAVATAQR